MIKETYNYDVKSYLIKLLTEAPMQYNTILFFFFITAFLIIYRCLKKPQLRRVWILAGSAVFYVWSGLSGAVIIFATALTVYIFAGLMGGIYEGYEAEKDKYSPKEQTAVLARYKARTRFLLIAAVVLTGGIWAAVKVCRVMGFGSADTFSDMLDGKSIVIPMGISYYTLSSAGYLFDVYWRKTKPEKNFFIFLTAVTYFPHIVQGPISKYSDLCGQLRELPRQTYRGFCFGLQLMLWGYIKKIVIADRLSVLTSEVSGNLPKYAGAEIVLAVLLGAVWLYADFSGCMDIVRGISECMGIKLAENFRQPFFASNAQEFWNRWHITLGAWTKEYIYLPISVNPKFLKYTSGLRKSGKKRFSSFIKSFLPLIAVWLFTGLWHGTGTDYIVWGLYWCAVMTLSKELSPLWDKLRAVTKTDTSSLHYRIFTSVRTFLLFAVGRTFTSAGSLEGCAKLWSRMFSSSRLWIFTDGSLYQMGLDSKDFGAAMAGIAVMLAVDLLHERGAGIRESIEKLPLPLRWIIYYGAIIALLIFGMYGPGYNAQGFVYGRF